MNLTFLLGLLKVVGTTVAKAPEFIALYNQGVAALHTTDQSTAKAMLAAVQAGNDSDHAKLQAALAEAAKRA